MTGREFNALLAALGWPQKRFAGWLGVDPRTVSRWACTRREIDLGACVALRLAIVLGMIEADQTVPIPGRGYWEVVLRR